MAVPEQTPYSEHTGNGSTKSFSLDFQCETKDHLIVLVDDVEPPIATWSLSGGSVVFTTAPALGKKITLQRNTPFNRTTEYQSFNNSFRPQTVNSDFDRLWLKLQELGVADWLLRLYVDRLHSEQELNINQKAKKLQDNIESLSDYVDSKNTELQKGINNLKDYVDDKDDELRTYLLDEISKQGVELDQLDNYYRYLMQRLAQIAVDKGWDASFIVDGNLTQHERNLGVKSVAQLRLISPARKGDRVYLASVNEDQGEGGGDFIATQKSGLVDDGGTIIASPNPLLFWVRVNYSYVTPEMFGAVGNDNTKDDAIPLQKTFSHKLPAKLQPKRYFTSMPIYYQSAKEVQGLTELDCRIIKTTNNTLSFGNQTINGKVMNFDIDAVIVGMPRSGDWYCQQNHISGFKAEYYSLMPTLGIGMYVPLLCLSTYKNMQFNNVSVGLKTVESWMVTWERIQCNAKQTGFLIGAEDTNWQANSTSQVFTACWAVGCQEYAWDVRFMQYSTMISCASDHTGADGAPAKALYRFKYSDVDLIKCGAETVHAYQLFSLLGSRVKVTNFNGQLIWNKYRPTPTTWDNSGAMISVTSNSQLEIDGGSYDFRYNSSTAPGDICSAAAYVEGGSLLKINRSAKIAIEKLELNSFSAPPRDMGLFYAGDSSIDVDLNIITTRRGPLFNNKQNHTQQALNYNTFSTAQANPSTFRGYGVSFLSSAFTATNTISNGYPDNGNVHVIQQIGTVTGNRLNYAARLDFSMWDGGGRMYVGYGYYDKEYTNWAQVWTSTDSIPQSATQIGKGHLTTTGTGTYDIGATANRWKRAWLTNLNIGDLLVFADNAAAKTAGLVNGEFYRTSAGQVMVVF